MKVPEKVDNTAVESAVAMIRAMDAHDEAIRLATRLKLNAEVRTCVGKWDERGSITGWTKVTKAREPASVLVEVFISDVAGGDREFDRYARTVKRLIEENEKLRAELAELKP